jgi:Ser/Thr protein kinase RdoA (MazF antagonist)
MTVESSRAPYSGLTPERILDAVESLGLRCDARLLALNSYENRVYQVGIEDGAPVVVKFYRPGRWTDAAILEEHEFCRELVEAEVPVVAPLEFDGRTLHQDAGLRFTVFPRRGGRWPELDVPDNLRWIGRFLGRIHAVGARAPFVHRPTLGIEEFGEQARAYLLQSGFIPVELEEAYRTLSSDLLARIRQRFEDAAPVRGIRLHGDCHPGNILWTDDGPHFVDLDDCRTGPAIQDLWMLLSGERDEMAVQLGHVLEGYSVFSELDSSELLLIEPLRTLRIMHYAAWLARRWDDPAFPLAFPWFNSQRYWQDHVLSLREQVPLLEEPALPMY